MKDCVIVDVKVARKPIESLCLPQSKHWSRVIFIFIIFLRVQRVEKAEIEAKILTCEVKSDKKSIPISLYNPTHNSVLMHFNV